MNITLKDVVWFPDGEKWVGDSFEDRLLYSDFVTGWDGPICPLVLNQ